jgi:hypothetical protein
LEVTTGAHVEVSRAVFERNMEGGVVAWSEGTSLSMTDVVVRDTQSLSDGIFGHGLEVNTGAHVEVSRAVFERNREQGVFASDTTTTLSMTDVVVRDTQYRSDGTGGEGLEVSFGAQVEVSNAVFERNREVGVYAVIAG